MGKIKIVTDSSAQFTDEELVNLDVTIVPLSVMIDDVVYIDGETLHKSDFMDKMEQASALPKTSQPAIGKFVEIYDQLGEDGSEIISIHMTEKLSGTVNAARQAAQLSQTEVTVFESDFTDWGLTFPVEKAVEMANNGASKEEILSAIQTINEHTTLYIGVTSLNNLVKGGRVSKVIGALSNMLNMKVVFELVKGDFHILMRGRGMKSIYKWFEETKIEMQNIPNIKRIGVSHAGAKDFGDELKDELQAVFPTIPIVNEQTGPIVATHTGRGAFAIIFYTDGE